MLFLRITDEVGKRMEVRNQSTNAQASVSTAPR
jgi:hypothetical protein